MKLNPFYNLLWLWFDEVLAQKDLCKVEGNIVVWIEITTLVRSEDLCWYGYKNKYMVKVAITSEGFVI